MEKINLKKQNIKALISAIVKLERKNLGFFRNNGIIDYLDLDISDSGFKISFSSKLPSEIILQLSEVFNHYTLPKVGS